MLYNKNVNQKTSVTILIVVAVLVGIVWCLFSFSFLFKTNDYRNLPTITFQGDGTYSMKNDAAVMLNNGISIKSGGVKKLEKGAISTSGSPVGVYEYPSIPHEYSDGSEVGVTLVINESRFVFLSPKNPEQQIIERGTITDLTHPGAVMKLVSIDADTGEATMSLRSIKGNVNLNNPRIILPFGATTIAVLVFLAEFIIKRRSTNVLYVYTFYRSLAYTLPVLLLISFSDPEWGIFVAILYFPIIFAESLLVSFIAYKVAIKGRVSFKT